MAASERTNLLPSPPEDNPRKTTVCVWLPSQTSTLTSSLTFLLSHLLSDLSRARLGQPHRLQEPTELAG